MWYFKTMQVLAITCFRIKRGIKIGHCINQQLLENIEQQRHFLCKICFKPRIMVAYFYLLHVRWIISTCVITIHVKCNVLNYINMQHGQLDMQHKYVDVNIDVLNVAMIQCWPSLSRMQKEVIFNHILRIKFCSLPSEGGWWYDLKL